MSGDLSRYLWRNVSGRTKLRMTRDAAVTLADFMEIQHVRGPLLQSVVLKVSLLEAVFRGPSAFSACSM